MTICIRCGQSLAGHDSVCAETLEAAAKLRSLGERMTSEFVDRSEAEQILGDAWRIWTSNDIEIAETEGFLP